MFCIQNNGVLTQYDLNSSPFDKNATLASPFYTRHVASIWLACPKVVVLSSRTTL